MPDPQPRHLRTAELLSIGSELTVGETVDTNAGETARALTELGVRVVRVSGLPDDLEIVAEAFRLALDRADLVVTTGGLGPTPDDLTREAIAAVCGETPTVDPELERWLRALFARRRLAFPESNLKQAWTIPSATPLPNANGTAPGWWVDRPDGRVIVALPGPPREKRAMWSESVLPRLRGRGLGGATAVRTFRLAGIGESLVAERLGDDLLRAANPSVATYARVEAVDVRISTVDAADGSASAAELLEATAERVLRAVGDHVWAEGDTTWAEAIEAELEARGWRLAMTERGTAGALVGLVGRIDRLALAEVRGDVPGGPDEPDEDASAMAGRVRAAAGAEVGLAVRAEVRDGDMHARVAVVTPSGSHAEDRLAFLTGDQGRHRSAIAAAHVLLARLRTEPD